MTLLNSITTNIDANDIRNNPSILDFDHLEKQRKARFQTKEKLNNDTSLSEEEKIIKLKQYEDKGYYTHSPTTILDKNYGLMELKQESQKMHYGITSRGRSLEVIQYETIP